jgi:hypothetical protein
VVRCGGSQAIFGIIYTMSSKTDTEKGLAAANKTILVETIRSGKDVVRIGVLIGAAQALVVGGVIPEDLMAESVRQVSGVRELSAKRIGK